MNEEGGVVSQVNGQFERSRIYNLAGPNTQKRDLLTDCQKSFYQNNYVFFHSVDFMQQNLIKPTLKYKSVAISGHNL